MNLKKLPLLGAPVSLAYFFATAGAFAKDIDAATLAKMAESSAVRMSCGVADSSVIITGVNTASAGAGAASANTAGTTIIGVLISMALLFGVALLSRRKAAKISPVITSIAQLKMAQSIKPQAPAEVGENEAKTVVDASVKTTAVRKAVCKQRIVREYRTKKLDVEAARSLLERAFSNGTATQTKEDNDSACLTR